MQEFHLPEYVPHCEEKCTSRVPHLRVYVPHYESSQLATLISLLNPFRAVECCTKEVGNLSISSDIMNKID